MDKQYNHLATEKKWQKFWGKEKPWTAKEDQSLPKLYVLDMFPYPSAEGLHVGHPEGYTASDIVARYLRMKGYNVLHPMGWDAFGLPAENFAIKTGINPKISTTKNIKNIKRQIQSLGFSYDWSREINTTNPEYYKWTQWIFLQMFKRGLAYEATVPINWCPSCKTGLANEEVVSGKCDRCGTAVVKKDMRQWLLRITKYADRLLEGLDKLDWPEPIKLLQRNWIGRSEGALVKFPITNIQYPIKSQLPNPKSQTNFKAQIPNPKQFIEVFTTRADTLFGATYLVLAPEHPLVAHSALARNASLNEASGSLVANRSEVEKYVRQAKSKSDLERTSLEKDKTGVELKGLSAINPATGKKIPIWVADYVLISYGTGAIMAVPAHDERDFEFAKKFNLPIEYVVAPHVVDSGNPPQSGKPTVERKTIQAIIYNPKTKSYLTLKWKEQSWRTFVVGGVEDDEDLAKAALREIREETGYIDLKLEGVMAGPVLAEYFASHKGENRRALATPILFSLKSEKCVTVSAEEKRRHEVEWWPIEKITGQTMRCVELPFWLARLRGEYVYTGEGVMINSEQYNGLPSVEGSKKITDWLEKKGLGKRSVNYKLRDWVFSRQRYWGEPIPLIHCLKCGVVPVPEDKLPVKLPEVKKYEPTGTGESPLAAIGSWVNVKCPKCGKPAKRETNTMPQWAGSCWYYLRYLDPDNENELVSAEKEKYWMGPSSAEDSDGKGGVDVYIGGAEHAVLHLLYARFWHMFLYDIGVVSTAEPFQTLKNQGIVLGEDGQKMSKSRGNVINPDNVIEEYGADSMRLYEMFMGPFEVVKPWSTQGLRGVYRFLQRVWSLREKVKEISVPEPVERLRHKLIKKITNDITTYNFNTAVSTFMETINTVAKQDAIPKIFWKTFLVLFSPFAPHLSEELWQLMGHEKSIGYERWPTYKEKLILEAEVEIIVQINGKLRDRIKAPLDSREEKIKKLALASGRVRKYLHRAPKKVIFVKDRLINFVI